MGRQKRIPSPSQKKKPDLLKGILTRSTGSWYQVRLENGEVHDCKLRGKFREAGFTSTNPVAVGDEVMISIEEDVGFIRTILPRRNYILRKSINLSRRVHILCANIDQALLLFTLNHPVTTLGYIDRLLVSCEAYGIKPVLVFNKIDLVNTPELHEKLLDYEATYISIGYATIRVDSTDPKYHEQVVKLMKDRSSFVVGRSGAGKSTLINQAAPGLQLKTGLLSENSGRGRHTTTYAEMFELPFGGFIIDSPGFKEMEIYDIEKGELCHFFPEMHAYLDDCKFSNCIHQSEPGCAVKEAVENGEIPESRFHTYTGMVQEIDNTPENY